MLCRLLLEWWVKIHCIIDHLAKCLSASQLTPGNGTHVTPAPASCWDGNTFSNNPQLLAALWSQSECSLVAEVSRLARSLLPLFPVPLPTLVLESREQGRRWQSASEAWHWPLSEEDRIASIFSLESESRCCRRSPLGWTGLLLRPGGCGGPIYGSKTTTSQRGWSPCCPFLIPPCIEFI